MSTALPCNLGYFIGVLLLFFHLPLLGQSSRPEPGGTAFYQRVDIAVHCGKPFILRVAVKGRSEKSVHYLQRGYTLWASVLDAHGRLTRREGRWYSDVPAWSLFEVEGIIANEAQQLSFGLDYRGGDYRFDAFHLFVKQDDGRWESIPLVNAGFEAGRPGGRAPEGWQVPLHRGLRIGRVSTEVAYEGHYAYRVRSRAGSTQGSTPTILANAEPNPAPGAPGGALRTPGRVVQAPYAIQKIPLAEKGLSVNIDNIFEDRHGFLWFTTPFELVRFDGQGIRKYVPEVSDSAHFEGFFQGADIIEDVHDNLWFTARSGVYQFDLKTERFTFWSTDPNRPNYLNDATYHSIHGRYTALATDRFGNIYVGSSNGLVRLSFPEPEGASSTYVIQRFSDEPVDGSSLTLPHRQVLDLFVDRRGNIWVGTAVGLSKLSVDPESGAVLAIDNYTGPFEASAHYWRFQIIVESAAGHLTIFCQAAERGTRSGSRGRFFTTFDPDRADFRGTAAFDEDRWGDSSAASHLTDMVADPAGNLWFGTIRGLVYGTPPAAFRKLNFAGALRSPQSLHIDRDGNVWVGSRKFGLSKISRIREATTFYSLPHHFSAYRGPLDPPLLDLPDTMQFSLTPVFPIANAEDRQGNLWIEAPGNGLYRLDKDRQNKPAVTLHWTDEVRSRLYGDREGAIWSYYRRHLFHDLREIFPRTINYGNAGQTLTFHTETAKGELLIGTGRYFLLMDKATYAVRPIRFESYDFARPPFSDAKNLIHVDDQGRCWVINKGEVFQFAYRPAGVFPLINKYDASRFYARCRQIYDDGRGHLWLATNNGLLKLTKRTGEFTHFAETQNIGGPYFFIAPQGAAFLWLISSNGNFRFNLAAGKIDYTFKLDLQEVGLHHAPSEFNPVLTSGEIFIPARDGFYLFDPKSISTNSRPPRITFSNLWINNEAVSPGEQSCLTTALNYQEAIELAYDQNTLAIGYAAHHLLEPDQYQYAYILENWEADWNYVGSERVARYAQLRPGEYVFKVKAADPNGSWNDTGIQLQVTILPPWWWSPAAKFSYALLLLAGLYSLYRFQLNRRLAQSEARRLRELEQVKTRLYTNITHEFRTPLTVISGMVGRIRNAPAAWLEEGLQMIQRNSQQLLRLVNQLLDLSKLESGRLPVRSVQADFIAYLRYLLESFQSYAAGQDIQLHFLAQPEELVMDYDPDHLANIISNLLANAIKFTEPGGQVYVFVDKPAEGNTVRIRVKDTGIGIAEAQLPHIFDRFYQADDSTTRPGRGTGIGLALAKELVRLLRGRIEVRSEVGRGTEFIVTLPVSHRAPIQGAILQRAGQEWVDHSPGAQPVTTDRSPASVKKPSILVVEDNDDVVRYLVACLREEYQLDVARNGREGRDRAIEQVPDLIISDVMMPAMDGFELCATLKNDQRTSHIPIILLTAKGDQASRNEGLQGGADVYLIKPFDETELHIRIDRLLALRRTLRAYYGQSATGRSRPVRPATGSTLDEAFLDQITAFVTDHLADADLDVSQLCTACHMSRTQLHRKLKALTGLSTTKFINRIRLERAEALLVETEQSIKEIAYETGFNTPDYFSRLFTATYGRTPSSYRRNPGG